MAYTYTKPSERARTMFGPPRRRPKVMTGAMPRMDLVAERLDKNACPNGCGKLKGGACGACGFLFERCKHAPIPEWML